MIPHSKPCITPMDVDSVLNRLRCGMIGEGDAAETLECELRDRLGTLDAVAVGSGSQALFLALRALEVGPGDEVIIPTYTCAEILATVEAVGATGVLADIGEDYLLDPDAAIAVSSARTRAVVIPYTMGIWRDPTPFRRLGVPVIEDFAQLIQSKDQSLFSLGGDLAVLSFEATKVMTAAEGGMILTCDPYLSRALRAQKRFRDTIYRCNLFPMSDLQASLALSQLRQIDTFLERRLELAARYCAALEGISLVRLPGAFAERSAFFRFPVRVFPQMGLSSLIVKFANYGVTVRRPVDALLHCLIDEKGLYPMAENLYESTLSLPLYPALTDAQCDQVISVAKRVFSSTD